MANTPRPGRGAGHTLELLSRELAGPGRDARPAGRHPRPCWSCVTAPVLAVPRRALLQPLRRREAQDAAMPATVSRTDHRQRPPQARLRMPRATTAPLPSKLPLFGYKTRHDDQIVARTVKAAANSAALHTILPHVAE
jgi:hypothetical protein